MKVQIQLMELKSERDFDQSIGNIRRRNKERFSGYWFNLIEFKDCRFIQGNIDDEKSEQGINRNIAALVDGIRPDDIKGVWPKITGYPIDESEEEQLVKFISSQGENDVELIVPERNLARSVEWDRFDSTKEFTVYAAHIYPAILEALSHFKFHRLLDMGCGSGNLIQDIVKRSPDVTCYGIDVNPDNIEAAEEMNVPNIYPGDCLDVNDILPDGLLFDMVIFSGLLNKQVTKKEESVKILTNTLERIEKGGHIIITGYSSCYLTANDLTDMGLDVLRKSLPRNIFKDYFDYYLRQFYVVRKW